MDAIEFRNQLIEVLKKDSRILAIGQTGRIEEKLIRNFSDIDLFIITSEVPSTKERLSLYQDLMAYTPTMNLANGGIWGYGDQFHVDGIDVMPMFFTKEETMVYLKDVLNGKYLDKEFGFYPSGRCSTFENIHILYEKNHTLSNIIAFVNKHPQDYFMKLFDHVMNYGLDEEALGRAFVRHDVIFYHQVLENALDNILIALFCVNKTYFPSRKRTKEYIASFPYKPQNAYNRLLKIIEMGAKEETIEESIKELRKIYKEILELRSQIISY